MKKLLCMTVLVCAFNSVYSQTNSYQFEIENITTYSEAKPVITVLRKHYNSENSPRAFLPNFSDENDQFNVSTEIAFTENELATILANEGYQLILFKSNTINAVHNEKE